MVVNLVAFAPNGHRKDMALPEGRHVIGRNAGAQIRVPLATVSRQHCELVIGNSTVRVRDLGSSNGTYRNDERVQEAELHAGDVLTVGSFAFVVQINGHPAQVVAPTGDEADALIETPPNGTKTGATDSDDTVTRPSIGHPASGNTDDSSVFDFDFDFENDDNPQL